MTTTTSKRITDLTRCGECRTPGAPKAKLTMASGDTLDLRICAKPCAGALLDRDADWFYGEQQYGTFDRLTECAHCHMPDISWAAPEAFRLAYGLWAVMFCLPCAERLDRRGVGVTILRDGQRPTAQGSW